MFEEDNNIIEREIERVTDLNATMVEKINLLRQQSERYVTTRVLYCTVYCYVMLCYVTVLLLLLNCCCYVVNTELLLLLLVPLRLHHDDSNTPSFLPHSLKVSQP